jgi:hypothetical protein
MVCQQNELAAAVRNRRPRHANGATDVVPDKESTCPQQQRAAAGTDMNMQWVDISSRHCLLQHAACDLPFKSCSKNSLRAACSRCNCLQVGQMSDIIKTQFGYHLILCEGRKA